MFYLHSLQFLLKVRMQTQPVFPPEKRVKILQKFKQKYEKKVPIALFFNKQKKWKSLKQYMLVTIEPQSSLHQFLQVIKVKLVWSGYLDYNDRTLYLYVKQKQLIINEKKIQNIYDENKSEDGWLEIALMTADAFG